METFEVKAYGTQAVDADLKPINIKRRVIQPDDIEIDILYCGVCHSDLHTARNDWGGSVYPVVPGHEIVGRVTQVGKNVTKLKVGDLAGVGCIVDSCQHCSSCAQDLEQYCLNGFTGTYNAPDKILGGYSFGGYSEKVVVKLLFQHTKVVQRLSNPNFQEYAIRGVRKRNKKQDIWWICPILMTLN